jgi:hypothetical protein
MNSAALDCSDWVALDAGDGHEVGASHGKTDAELRGSIFRIQHPFADIQSRLETASQYSVLSQKKATLA